MLYFKWVILWKVGISSDNSSRISINSNFKPFDLKFWGFNDINHWGAYALGTSDELIIRIPVQSRAWTREFSEIFLSKQ